MAGNLVPFNFLQQSEVKPRIEEFEVPLINCRVWDAPMTSIPTSAANDDLGITVGTWASSSPRIVAGDVKATSSTRYTRFQFVVPDGFDQYTPSLTLRVNCGMVTTVAGTSCTIDAVVYKYSDATLSADLCATAAQSMNSLTAANRDFVITPTGIAEGDLLDVRLAIAYVDAATATAVTPTIYAVKFVASIR